MKKLSALLLATAMCFILIACSNNASDNTKSLTSEPANDDTSVSSNNQNSTSTNDANSIEESSQSDDANKFVPNEDLRVVAAFNYDNHTYVVIENVGEQAILNYSVAYMSFDKNGFVATKDSDGYEMGRADTINLMPGEKYISSWYGADGNYTVAAVIGVDYQDGSTWEATQLKDWATSTRSEFDVDTHRAELAALKEFDSLAEANEYAVLTDYYIKHGNRYSSDYDFHFSIKNTSNQGITRLNVFVLEFDENGFPVSVSPYDTYCLNGHSTGGTVNLAANGSGSYSDNLFISSTTTQIKVAISYMEFQDGTDWTNPYIYEWIIANNGIY